MALAEYLAEVARALEVFLRPQRGALHARWLGVDTERRSFLLLRSEHGFSAQLVGSWLGAPVVEKWGHAAGIRVRSPMHGLDSSARTKAHFTLGIKRLTGECNCEIALDIKWNASVTLKSRESTLLVIGPEAVLGLTDAQFAALHGANYDGPPPLYGIPEWTIGIVSNVASDREMRGFDPDPIITANGLAESILMFAGERPAGIPNRYGTAAADLRWAISTLSSENESVLQELIERKPWILVHEGEYDEVTPRRRTRFVERLADGTEGTVTAVPDFIFHQTDGISLIVEIESATKRLFVEAAEVSFQVGSSPTLHALFQIFGYRRLFSGALGSQARRELGKPDSWSFRYLLVVGSRLQREFDQRSWASLRDTVFDAGIELRNWDYYIERLERIAQAASMDRP